MTDDDGGDSRWGPLTPWLVWGLWPFSFLLFVYGLLCIARQDGVLWYRHAVLSNPWDARLELHGADALALGVVYAMLGGSFGAAPFCRRIRDPRTADMVAIFWTLTFVGCVTFIMVRVLMR